MNAVRRGPPRAVNQEDLARRAVEEAGISDRNVGEAVSVEIAQGDLPSEQGIEPALSAADPGCVVGEEAAPEDRAADQAHSPHGPAGVAEDAVGDDEVGMSVSVHITADADVGGAVGPDVRDGHAAGRVGNAEHALQADRPARKDPHRRLPHLEVSVFLDEDVCEGVAVHVSHDQRGAHPGSQAVARADDDRAGIRGREDPVERSVEDQVLAVAWIEDHQVGDAVAVEIAAGDQDAEGQVVRRIDEHRRHRPLRERRGRRRQGDGGSGEAVRLPADHVHGAATVVARPVPDHQVRSTVAGGIRDRRDVAGRKGDERGMRGGLEDHGAPGGGEGAEIDVAGEPLAAEHDIGRLARSERDDEIGEPVAIEVPGRGHREAGKDLVLRPGVVHEAGGLAEVGVRTDRPVDEVGGTEPEPGTRLVRGRDREVVIAVSVEIADECDGIAEVAVRAVAREHDIDVVDGHRVGATHRRAPGGTAGHAAQESLLPAAVGDRKPHIARLRPVHDPVSAEPAAAASIERATRGAAQRPLVEALGQARPSGECVTVARLLLLD